MNINCCNCVKETIFQFAFMYNKILLCNDVGFVKCRELVLLEISNYKADNVAIGAELWMS